MLSENMKKYLMENKGMEFFSNHAGFAIYKLIPENKALYIEAMSMEDGTTKADTNEILNWLYNKAIKNDCNKVWGEVDTSLPKATVRTLGHIRRGYKITGSDNKYIYFEKEL